MNEVRTYIEPIKKKWVYHFIVSPKTSLIEKPEWYLNQTLKWVYEHIDTVEAEIKSAPGEANVRQLFILSMLELAHMRLSKDMKKISKTLDEDHQAEAILIHTYNEVVQFVKVVRQLLGERYEDLEEKQDLMEEFSDQVLFEKLDEVEWDCSKKNLREITSCESRWDLVLDGDYTDYYKIPRCIDRFLLLIRSISDRVDCFRQLDCKFRLIDLQCSLFDKLLKFMKNSTESAPLSKNIISDIFFFADDSTIDLSKILRVLNGVNFLRLILKERCFISSADVSKQLDKELKSRLDKTTQDYVKYFNALIDKVVNIYNCTDCDPQTFHKFVKPKLSLDIYEIVRDETSKIHQTLETQSMLKSLSLGRE